MVEQFAVRKLCVNIVIFVGDLNAAEYCKIRVEKLTYLNAVTYFAFVFLCCKFW